MKRSIFISVLLLAVIGCENNNRKTKTSQELSDFSIDKIDSICKNFLGKGNTVGFSVGLAHNGKVIFSKGYGLANLESNKKATDSTIYAIASVSKFITSIATLKLAEEGKLKITDKVTDYLSDFPKQPYMDEIFHIPHT